ncbi:MAG: hypothetical protein NTX52_00800, partial [Planctomycetota bacterium]|nr:hypothetical protein [Planctomycetota bacterium]
MRTILILVAAVVLSVFGGCSGVGQKKALSSRQKNLSGGPETLLTVDFQKGQTLQYRFVSNRDVDLDWEPGASASKSGRHASDKLSESMEMVMTYTPIEVNPYGLTTVKATCNSVKVTRSKGTGGRGGTKDAVESLPGKTFTFTVGPTGKIEDYSQLEKLIQEISKQAFRAEKNRGRIKEPDMISDFIATQWFLWDSVSSIPNPSEGVATKQSWKSKLSIPAPMPVMLRKAREVTYTLDEVRQVEKERLAVIKSSYQAAESAPKSWPLPYSGSFQMAGTFCFLRGYKVIDLQGQGEELFNIDLGRIERHSQQYQVQLEASMPMGINVNPRITIKQTLTMERQET